MSDEPVGDGRDLLALAIEAHGGEERWRGLEALELRYRAGGLGFAMKMRGLGMRAFDVRVDAREPRAVLRAFPRAGQRGVLDGHDVRIETDAGEVVAARERAVEAFRHPRRLVRWDDLDATYFSGYAIWG